MGQVTGITKRRGRPRRDIALDQIRELRSQGLSFRAIAHQLRIGYGTVRRAYWASEPRESAAAD